MDNDQQALIPVERIEQTILLIRRQKVMLDADLAKLYGVTTKRLNEQVKRNLERFPEDFMFRLTTKEFEILRSHLATSRSGWGGRRTLPYAFTEHGAVMLASLLDSPTAIRVSIQVVRAFVRLRQILADHKELARAVEELGKKYNVHDIQIKEAFQAIRQIMEPPQPKQERREESRLGLEDSWEDRAGIREKSRPCRCILQFRNIVSDSIRHPHIPGGINLRFPEHDGHSHRWMMDTKTGA